MATVGVVNRGGYCPYLRLPRPPTASPWSATAAANLQRPVCKFWLQGRCNRRPCRFLHSREPTPTDALRPPTPRQQHHLQKAPPPPPQQSSAGSSPRSLVWRNPNAVPASAPCPPGSRDKKSTVVDPEFLAPPTPAPPPPGVDGGDSMDGVIMPDGDAVEFPERLPPAIPTPPLPRDDGGGGDDEKGGITTPDAVEYLECLPRAIPTPPPGEDALDLAEGGGTGGPLSFSFVTSLGGHQQPITGIVLPSGSHHVFSGSSDGTVRVWDCDSGRCVQVLELDDPVSCLITDGHWVFAGGCRGVRGCNTLAGSGLVLPGPAGQVCSLATSKDTVFAGMADGSILAWKLALDETGLCFRPAASLGGHTAAVVALMVGNNWTRLYSGSADRTIRAWELGTLQCIYAVSAHDDVVTSLLCWNAFLLSCSLDGTIKAWARAAKEDEDLELVHTRREDQGVLLLNGTYDVEEGPVLMCSLADSTVCLYDLPSFSDRGRIACTGEVTAMHTGPHGFFFTGDAAGELSVWRWAQL